MQPRLLQRLIVALQVALLVALLLPLARAHASDAAVPVTALPPAARQTLFRIRAGGPFPYARDGVVFGNYERHLPARPRGYYHEYTVPTPAAGDRGPRRIVAGGASRRADAYWYTDDHYRTFRRIVE